MYHRMAARACGRTSSLSHQTWFFFGVTHDVHNELAAALGRRRPLKRLSPSPSTSRGPSCEASLCTAAGWGGGHHSIKHKMHWPARSLLFVHPGVCLGWVWIIRAEWDPHTRSPPSHSRRGALVSQRDMRPKATKLCQSHHCYGKSTLLYT